ncbi:MAG: sialidase family protein [Rhodospirillales bacterium]
MFQASRVCVLQAMIPFLTLAAPNGGFIFESAPFPSCHASTLVETASGELLAAWFGGSAEGRPDVAIWGARRSKGVWSEPFELAREPNIAAYNPVLFFAPNGTLWLYYKFGPSPREWTAARRFSRDRGKTWSPIEHLPAGLYGPIKNKPLVLPSGAIVSGTSVESYRAWSCWVERSTDNGVTWTRHGPIVVPDEPYGVIQPAIVPLPGGKLRMFVRATQRIGRICYADSSDGGLTWTAARPTTLPNPNSGIDAVALADGRIVLIYNHTEKGRSPLNAAVSRDGENWNTFLTLESEPGEFSYPAVIQAADGTVHATYTWNRKKIKHLEIPLKNIP